MSKRKINWGWVIAIIVAIFYTFLFIKGEGWEGFQAPTLSDQEIRELVKK
jgi:hypothetical protein